MSGMSASELKGFMRSALTAAQNGLCYLCGETIRPEYYHGPEACTFEHVHSVDGQRKRGRLRQWRFGNHLVAHQHCNKDKDNRPPTGCEILALFAANRKLGFPEGRTAHWDQAKGDCSGVLAQKPASQ